MPSCLKPIQRILFVAYFSNREHLQDDLAMHINPFLCNEHKKTIRNGAIWSLDVRDIDKDVEWKIHQKLDLVPNPKLDVMDVTHRIWKDGLQSWIIDGEFVRPMAK